MWCRHILKSQSSFIYNSRCDKFLSHSERSWTGKNCTDTRIKKTFICIKGSAANLISICTTKTIYTSSGKIREEKKTSMFSLTLLTILKKRSPASKIIPKSKKKHKNHIISTTIKMFIFCYVTLYFLCHFDLCEFDLCNIINNWLQPGCDNKFYVILFGLNSTKKVSWETLFEKIIAQKKFYEGAQKTIFFP